MKKEYLKPNAEYLEFYSNEDVTTAVEIPESRPGVDNEDGDVVGGYDNW